MYRVIHGSTKGLADAQAFLDELTRLDAHPAAAVRHFFTRTRDIVVARAPGRLDVFGGIADYSGSRVLQLPLREATLVAMQRDADRMVRLVSLDTRSREVAHVFEMPLAHFEREDGQPIDYDTARAYFGRHPDRRWAAYVAGAFLVLMRERSIRFREGARLLISSTVPPGAGVSSSAALEVATMWAIGASAGIAMRPREAALLCQRVENLVAGAPCGVMDQMTAVCGHANRLMELLCQPAELQGYLEIPPDLAFWGIDSGVRHAVSGSDYGAVRVGAAMGYRMLCDFAGLPVEAAGPGRVRVEDARWRGYLANVTPRELGEWINRIPVEMSGAAFLERYGGIADPVVHVDPSRTYAVRVPTAHPVYEHAREREIAAYLDYQAAGAAGPGIGALMYASHDSYGACGLGSTATDRLVALVRELGPARGLFGAKITGGGSGGTVAVLGLASAGDAVQEVAERYERETGYRARVFSGSSPGAASFGSIRLRAG